MAKSADWYRKRSLEYAMGTHKVPGMKKDERTAGTPNMRRDLKIEVPKKQKKQKPLTRFQVAPI